MRGSRVLGVLGAVPVRVALAAVVVLMTLALPELAGAQQAEPGSNRASRGGVANPAGSELPDDPDVVADTLDNGLQYIIRENEEPESRAVLRLVVNAGSVLEEEDELGIAHFVEHMAFRGTESYSRDEIIGFLEGVGMEYGPHVNAYVSFDETVFKMRLPTDDQEAFDQGIDIMSEWAHRIEFDPDDIDHERGVIKEEWRARLGSAQRVRDEQLPVVLHDSRYAERLPIGDMDIVSEASPETIEGFYDQWYRPELMAVIAVGDFNAAEIEERIEESFGVIPESELPKERPEYEVPEHDETLYAISEDPELSQSSVSLYRKGSYEPLRTVEDFRQQLTERLFQEIVDVRLARISRESDPPFVDAAVGEARVARPVTMGFMGAVLDEDGEEAVETAVSQLIQEIRRVDEHGIETEELERAKRAVEREAEREYRRRDQLPSEQWASRYVEGFLDQSRVVSPQARRELTEEIAPEVEVEDVQAVADQYLGEENRVVTVSMIETEERELPPEDELAEVVGRAEEAEVGPYDVDLPPAELAVAFTERGEIVEERYHEDLSLYEWELSNGATVFVRPTEFRSDDVQLSAYAPGGESRVDDDEIVNARIASDLVYESGVNELSRSDLEGVLAGLDVELVPYIDRNDHGFAGSSGTEEVEQLLQLLAMYMTGPRRDGDAYDTVRRRMQTELQNLEADPQYQFSKALTRLLWDDPDRVMPLTVDRLGELEMEGAYDIYEQLFSNPGEFTITLVGDLDLDRLRPLVERYLAAIPGEPAEPDVVDRGERFDSGVRRETVETGMAPQSLVALVFHGDHEYSAEENYLLRSLGEVVQRRMRDYLREELGAVYQSGAIGTPMHVPWERYAFELVFATDPQKADELSELALEELESIRAGELDESYVERTREVQRSEFEEALRENEFWLENIEALHRAGREFEELLDYPDLIDELTVEALVETAEAYLNPEEYVQVTLLPAGEPPAQPEMQPGELPE